MEENEFGWDPLDTISDLADGAEDLITSVWDRIPGSDLLGDGVKALVTGPLRDFAKSDVGGFLLNAMAAAAGNAGHAAGLASFMPILGPAILISSAAIPGIAQGKSFGESLAQGWVWRLETAAQIVGPQIAAKFGNMVGEAGNKLKDQVAKLFPNVNPKEAIDKLASMGIDASKAASRGISELQAQGIPTTEQDAVRWAFKQGAELGIRPDALLQAIDLNSGSSYFNIDNWDIENGTYKKPLPQITSGGGVIKSFGKRADISTPKVITSFGRKTMATPCEEYAAMLKSTSPNKAVLAALKSRCEASKFKGVIKPPLASAVTSPIASTATTVAAKAAISAASTAPANSEEPASTVAPPILQTAQKVSDSRSTKLGIIAGVAGAAVGAGGSILAGLSYTLAAPVAIGFGVGAGVGTKLLTRKK